MALFAAILLVLSASTIGSAQPASVPPMGRAVLLDAFAWNDAERQITADAVVVLPIGNALANHGSHLRADADHLLVDHLRRNLSSALSVVVLPTLPVDVALAEPAWRGGIALPFATIRDVIVELCRSVARRGAHRFYVLGLHAPVSPAVDDASRALASEGLLLRGADLAFDSRLLVSAPLLARGVGMPLRRETHGGEIETSMILAIDPTAVDLARASSPLRATAERGKTSLFIALARVREDVDSLRQASLPAARPGGGSAPRADEPAPARTATSGSPGDEQDLHRLALDFQAAWRMQNAWDLADLWTEDGDMVHPDGTTERGRTTIAENRARLFSQRRYRTSVHPLKIGMIRFRGSDIAVVDGRWELRQLQDDQGGKAPSLEGLFTWIARRETGRWKIAGWRYTIGEPTSVPGRTPER